VNLRTLDNSEDALSKEHSCPDKHFRL